mmetsp:Transcript_11482/g.11437  ORF Transcript_11482/g.11437 Transcript_11482/m.11437 type:complete len:251 (-) Transcript_11482:579-1331(-)
MKELQTSDSNPSGYKFNHGPVWDTSTTTNSRMLKMNSSRSSFTSQKKDGYKFAMAERNLEFPVSQYPKVGPGSYFKEDHLNRMKFAKTSKNSSQFSTQRPSVAKSLHSRHNTENIKKRQNTQYFHKFRGNKKKVNSICANFEDSDSDYESDKPGPGSYYNPEIETNFKTKQDSTPFQYFGTTSPRFQTSDNNKNPGPGTYKQKVEIPRKGEYTSSVFKKERRIDTIFEKFMSPGPGPGKYNNAGTDFHSK